MTQLTAKQKIDFHKSQKPPEISFDKLKPRISHQYSPAQTRKKLDIGKILVNERNVTLHDG